LYDRKRRERYCRLYEKRVRIRPGEKWRRTSSKKRKKGSHTNSIPPSKKESSPFATPEAGFVPQRGEGGKKKRALTEEEDSGTSDESRGERILLTLNEFNARSYPLKKE